MRKIVEERASRLGDVPYSEKEIDALSSYTSIEYKSINAYLRGQTKELSPSLKRDIETIDKAFEKHSLDKPLVIYRGVSNQEFEGTDNAYKSTSLSPYGAYNFTRGSESTVRAYLIPEGTKAIYIGGGEKELLLPRDFDLSQYELK